MPGAGAVHLIKLGRTPRSNAGPIVPRKQTLRARIAALRKAERKESLERDERPISANFGSEHLQLVASPLGQKRPKGKKGLACRGVNTWEHKTTACFEPAQAMEKLAPNNREASTSKSRRCAMVHRGLHHHGDAQ